jgi:hypothetical protein
MQPNSTQTTYSCVSTATTVTRTDHDVAIYMYIAYLVYTAITDITRKKNPLFFQ